MSKILIDSFGDQAVDAFHERVEVRQITRVVLAARIVSRGTLTATAGTNRLDVVHVTRNTLTARQITRIRVE